ncbi:MAG TPA: preprotein translocase subunit SecG [Rhizomicrobium sp.]|nr:preprotein translocase subunit SecG [Rhizomicrobium sp.]
MQAILIIIQLVVSVGLIGVVLLQRSEGGALGMGGGGSGLGMFTPRGAADTLTRTTVVLAVLFFVCSLALTILALHGRPQAMTIDSAPSGTTVPLNQPKAPSGPAKPEVPAVPTPH